MSAPTRTTSEIARRFAGKGNEAAVARISRRLENWGNIGLLTPVGERSTGRGRARAYDELEQIKAAVLLLTFAYQTPKAVLELVSRLFDDIRSLKSVSRPTEAGARSNRPSRQVQTMARLLKEAKAGKENVYLMLEPGEPEDLPIARFGPSLEDLKDMDSAMVLNITRAIKRVS